MAAPGSPHRARAQMTEDTIREATGKTDLNDVTDLEIIFTDTPELSALEHVPNLRSLCLIDTHLSSIGSLACVGRTLESLTLINQGLQRMEGLFLPNLRELFLQHNALKKIEGLEGCPKLQRLWLFGNQIAKMENLHSLGDLRELWLQENRISHVAGLDHLVALRELQLAANPIEDFKELQRLAGLPNLREVSFSERNFGACPIADQEGYRNFVLCALKQVLVLDGEEVEARDRSTAEDEYMQKVLEFNDRIDALRRDNERELLAIETRRRRNESRSDTLQGELLAAFKKLEGVVTTGRAKVAREQERQLGIRSSNLTAVRQALAEAQREHTEVVEELIEEERRKMAAEEKRFAELAAEARLELDEAVLISELQFGQARDVHAAGDDEGGGGSSKGLPRVALQALRVEGAQAQSAELRSCVVDFASSQQRLRAAVGLYGSSAAADTPSGGVGYLRVHRATKAFNAVLYHAHSSRLERGLGDSDSTSASSSHPRALTLAEEKVYICLPDANAVQLGLSRGPRANFSDASSDTKCNGGALVLCTDPRCAIFLAKRGEGVEVGSATAGESPKSAALADSTRAFHRLLVCRVAPGLVHNSGGAEASPPSSLQEAQVWANRIPKGSNSLCHTYGVHGDTSDGSGNSAQVFVVPAQDADLVLVEGYILASEELSEADDAPGVENSEVSAAPSLEQLLRDLVPQPHSSTLKKQLSAAAMPMPPESERRLLELERRVETEVEKYETRVMNELDPATAAKLSQADAEVLRLQTTLETLRAQIDAEKSSQEQILREFRTLKVNPRRR